MRRRDPALLRLLKYEYDECAICGLTVGLHLHHILLRSRGGDDVRANIVPLCLGCHIGYHDGSKRALLAEYLCDHRPDSIEYLVEKLGKGGMESWLAVHTST